MEITYKTISKMWQDDRFQSAGFDYCAEYGEPGYQRVGTAGVLLADWWCKCGTVLREDGTPELHGFELHYPRLFAALEEQGYELEWSDEWVVDHESGKCYRTQGDSYSWQSSILWTDGDFLTPDAGIDAWIEELVNDPHRCMTSTVWTRGDLEGAGFVQWERDDPHTYESGWHPGQDDDPEAITQQIRAELGDDVEILFYLDDSGQFDVRFSAWTRGTGQHWHTGHNVPGYLPMSDEAPMPMTWNAARDSMVDDLERYADHAAGMVDDGNDSDGYGTSLLASIEEAIREVRAADVGDELNVNVCSDGAHDLGENYWLAACQEEECQEEED